MDMPRSIVSATLNLSGLPSPANPLLFPINPPAWSLFFEFLINIAFASLLFRLGDTMLRVFTAITASIFVIIIFHYGDAGVGPGWQSSLAGLVRVSYWFSLGMVFARFRNHIDAIPSQVSILASILLAGLLLVPITQEITMPFNMLAVFIVLPGILWMGIVFDLPRTLRPAGKFLGDISYPLYAVHMPLLQMATYGVRRFDLPVIPSMMAFAAGSIATAWALAHFLDAPARKWLSREFLPRPKAL